MRDSISRRRRASTFDRLGKQVECRLRPENRIGHLLKAEQIHGLIVELIHAPASVLRGRLADHCRGELNRSNLLQARQQQRQDHSGRVSDHHRRRLQCNLVDTAQFALHPGRAKTIFGVVLQGVAEVDDLRAGIANRSPRSLQCRIRRRSGRQNPRHPDVSGSTPLDECRLVIDLFELAERIFFVKQA